jgi:hypothetical protein
MNEAFLADLARAAAAPFEDDDDRAYEASLDAFDIEHAFVEHDGPLFPACCVCGGPTYELGQLGNLLHLRCRNCGIDHSIPLPFDTELIL